MLKIHFLGTGTSQGIPVIGSTHPVCLSDNSKDKRLRVSVLIQWKNTNLVIDCGPDFRQQMLRTDCTQLDGILFTHEHADHTAGLDDIRPYFFRQGNIPVYGSQRVLDNLSMRFGYIFSSVNKYPGAPSVDQHEITSQESFIFKEKTIIPVEVYHNTLAVMGFRIDNFCYLTDVKTISEEEHQKLKDLDVLVLSALRTESHPNHLNLEEALEMIEKINPKKAYLTHISHLMGFHDEVSEILPPNVFLAYDTLTVTSN
ncbi:MBL fold metallo-hydrolase [Flavobacteriaceae bacterium]|nr:MBL fold metallo-hydrolase [Flavobacteriaceae bacterium]MDA9015887.1 MBL fold metallo-hydrolase [Flavobacteriaceae bacterium]MDB3861970.1 MBL fold metallo-hydrolase [Flavobacteriaceae bacterium]